MLLCLDIKWREEIRNCTPDVFNNYIYGIHSIFCMRASQFHDRVASRIESMNFINKSTRKRGGNLRGGVRANFLCGKKSGIGANFVCGKGWSVLGGLQNVFKPCAYEAP